MPTTLPYSIRRVSSESDKTRALRPITSPSSVTVMTLYCSPRARTGKGRSIEGSGLYPELAAYRIGEGCSPNVQAEVG